VKKGTVDIITLGCSKNLVDSEKLMAQLRGIGLKVRHDPDVPSAEIVIVNTCGFIGDAQEESIQMILECGELKKKGKIGRLFVMGCLSQKYKADLEVEIPEVDGWYGKFDWDNIVRRLGYEWNCDLANDRVVTTPPHYAYLKISEGCNRNCAYCAIPLMTGHYRSRSADDILDEARKLVEKGVREIQLIAQDLTYYGTEVAHRPMIADLVKRLSDLDGLDWIRLHYGYPNDFPMDLLDVMRERDNVCKYMDLALQHISDPVLKRMHRHINGAQTRELLAKIRETVPGIHIRTTLMVGFPGETDSDFLQLVDFVREQRFERMGAFAYCEVDGTYSALNYSDDVSDEIKQSRLSRLMRVQQDISEGLNQEKVGKVFKTMIDRREGDWMIGRTEFDSPDVDSEILVPSQSGLETGKFYNVRMTGASEFDLYGELV